MHRPKKSNNSILIQRRLSEILLRESKDPRFRSVTITRVEAAPDSSFAKILVSMFPSEGHEAVVESLNRASGFFSRQLGHVLKIRNTPRLTFVFDGGLDYSDEIDALIRKYATPPESG